MRLHFIERHPREIHVALDSERHDAIWPDQMLASDVLPSLVGRDIHIHLRTDQRLFQMLLDLLACLSHCQTSDGDVSVLGAKSMIPSV